MNRRDKSRQRGFELISEQWKRTICTHSNPSQNRGSDVTNIIFICMWMRNSSVDKRMKVDIVKKKMQKFPTIKKGNEKCRSAFRESKI